MSDDCLQVTALKDRIAQNLKMSFKMSFISSEGGELMVCSLTNTIFNTPNGSHREMAPDGRRGSKRNKGVGKARDRRKPRTDSVREQPIAETDGCVPCQLCGHPVDPKRMHFHHVRFHGVAIRSRGFQA
jgi:hypothetical protein